MGSAIEETEHRGDSHQCDDHDDAVANKVHRSLPRQPAFGEHPRRDLPRYSLERQAGLAPSNQQETRSTDPNTPEVRSLAVSAAFPTRCVPVH